MPAPSYEDFNGNVRAHLLYALGLPWKEGIQIFRRRLEDGTWQQESFEWITRLGVLLNRDAPRELVDELRIRFAETLLKGQELPRDGTLPFLFGEFYAEARRQERFRDLLAQLAHWFVQVAPVDAVPLAAQVLTRWLPRYDEATPAKEALPLVEWFLACADAPLPLERQEELLLQMLRTLLAAGATGAPIRDAVHRLLSSKKPLDQFALRKSFWPLVQVLLSTEESLPLAEEFFTRCLENGFARGGLLTAFWSSSSGTKSESDLRTRPDEHSRAVFLRALARAQIASHDLVAICSKVVAWETPAEVVEALPFPDDPTPWLDGLRQCAIDILTPENPGSSPPHPVWSRTLVSKYLRRPGGLHRPETYKQLQSLTGWHPQLDQGMAEALRGVLDKAATGPELHLVQAILPANQPPTATPSAFVASVLMVLEDAARARSSVEPSVVPPPSSVGTGSQTELSVSRVVSVSAANEPVPKEPSTTIDMSIPKPKRVRIFISYSHKDVTWLEPLRAHLSLLTQRYGDLEVWDDSKIAPGEKWREQIRQAMDSAKVAILLVSRDFLASDFIDKNELPPLLASAAREGTMILPVLLKPCLWQAHKELEKYQFSNAPERPLSKLSEAEQDEEWVRLGKRIWDLYSELSPNS
jgi:hypothetical protein